MGAGRRRSAHEYPRSGGRNDHIAEPEEPSGSTIAEASVHRSAPRAPVLQATSVSVARASGSPVATLPEGVPSTGAAREPRLAALPRRRPRRSHPEAVPTGRRSGLADLPAPEFRVGPCGLSRSSRPDPSVASRRLPDPARSPRFGHVDRLERCGMYRRPRARSIRRSCRSEHERAGQRLVKKCDKTTAPTARNGRRGERTSERSAQRQLNEVRGWRAHRRRRHPRRRSCAPR